MLREPIRIYPYTEMAYPKNGWTGLPIRHKPKREVLHPFYYMTEYKGTESKEEYIERVAREKRRYEFDKELRFSRFAMGTPEKHVYDPLSGDYTFARNCWARVVDAMAYPLSELTDD